MDLASKINHCRLTDKQRIRQLEKEILCLRMIFMIQIDRIEKIIGIKPDEVSEITVPQNKSTTKKDVKNKPEPSKIKAS